MSHGVVRTIASLALACTWLVTPRARAAEAERYEIDARIDASAGTIDATIAIDVRLGVDEDHVTLWLYPDRLAVAPSSMEERSWRWIYPGEIDRGGITLSDVAIDGAPVDVDRTTHPEGELRGRDFAGSDATIRVAPGQARTLRLTFAMHLDVPDRFGRLGRDGHTISLAAPWYPLVVDGDDWERDVPHALHAVVSGGEIRTRTAHAAEISVVEHVPYVPALVGGPIHERTIEVRGRRMTYVTTDPIYVPPAAGVRGSAGLEDIVGIDRVRLIGEAYADVIDTSAWLGLPIPDDLVVMAVHSRSELAAPAPRVALVSDRIFEIFPLDVVQEFHRRAVRRALFSVIVQPISAAEEASADRGWIDDLRSAALVDLDELRRNNATQTPQQLLSLFAFHPAVDQLLYAPQISFEDTYFGAIDEPDRFRDDPVRARFPVTRGRRLLECVRDVLEDEPMERFVSMLARAHRDVRAAMERAGIDVSRDLPAWLRYASLETNYRLGAIVTHVTQEGSYHTRVEILRDGDERPEPVEVEIEDTEGHHASAYWDGRGERGYVDVETPSDRSSVTIDPHQRLPESAHVADGHPRADDATNSPWRPPIFTAFALTVLASQADVNGVIETALRQRYNLENTVSLRLARIGARTGGRIGYIQGLGERAHTNRRIASLGGGIGFNYVRPDFPPGARNIGGYELDLQIFGGVDTRHFLQDPREFLILSGAIQLAGVFGEDGSFGVTARGAFVAAYLVPVGLLNAFLFAAGGGFTVNPILPADRQSIGGQYGLRAFANGELLGNGALYGVIEHRATIATDLNLNVLWGVFARELQLAWWVGGGAAFDTLEHDDIHLPVHAAFEAGAGIRVHYEYGGIAPGVLAIDVGAPISRWIRDGGLADPHYGPVGFYIGFDQYY